VQKIFYYYLLNSKLSWNPKPNLGFWRGYYRFRFRSQVWNDRGHHF